MVFWYLASCIEWLTNKDAATLSPTKMFARGSAFCRFYADIHYGSHVRRHQLTVQ